MYKQGSLQEAPKSFQEALRKVQKMPGQKSRNNYVGIFVQTIIPKGHFEINWLLALQFDDESLAHARPKKIVVLRLGFSNPIRISRPVDNFSNPGMLAFVSFCTVFWTPIRGCSGTPNNTPIYTTDIRSMAYDICVSKVRIFWEGHKIWKHLPLKIWVSHKYHMPYFGYQWCR